MDNKSKRTWLIVIVLLVVAVGWLWSRWWSNQKLMKALDSRNLQVAANAAACLLANQALEDSLPAQPVSRRMHAARALGALGTEPAFVQLLSLIKDPEDKPQEAASRAFAREGAASVPYLLQVLKEGDDRAKKAAIRALSTIGRPAIRPLTLALHDPQAGAKAAFTAAGDKPAATVLAALQGADLKEMAVKALAQIVVDRTQTTARYEPQPEAARVAQAAVQPLLAAAKDKDKVLRTRAIEALGVCREQRGVPDALLALADPEQRVVAIRALGMMGDSQATLALVPFLKDDTLRIDTVVALGEIADPRAIPYLLPELTDPEPQFQSRAVSALRGIGPRGAAALVAALGNPNVYVRRAVAQGLVGSDTPAANGGLSAAMRSDPDTEVRAAAAQALGWEGNAAAVPALAQALQDRSWEVADAAATALSRVGPVAIPALLALFSAGDDPAYYASLALSQMGKSGVPALLESLASPNPASRRWAAVTLGKLAEPDALPALQRLSQSSDARDRYVADEALRRMQAAGVCPPPAT